MKIVLKFLFVFFVSTINSQEIKYFWGTSEDIYYDLVGIKNISQNEAIGKDHYQFHYNEDKKLVGVYHFYKDHKTLNDVFSEWTSSTRKIYVNDTCYSFLISNIEQKECPDSILLEVTKYTSKLMGYKKSIFKNHAIEKVIFYKIAEDEQNFDQEVFEFQRLSTQVISRKTQKKFHEFVSEERMSFDVASNTMTTTYFENDQQTIHEYAIYERKIKKDSNGYEMYNIFLTKDGFITNSWGRKETNFMSNTMDEKGNVIAISALTPKMQPSMYFLESTNKAGVIIRKNLFSVMKCTYDQNNQTNSISYFDINGKAMINEEDNYHFVTLTHNDAGMVNSKRYFDTKMKMMNIPKTKYNPTHAGVEYNYDDLNILRRMNYIDELNYPLEINGICYYNFYRDFERFADVTFFQNKLEQNTEDKSGAYRYEYISEDTDDGAPILKVLAYDKSDALIGEEDLIAVEKQGDYYVRKTSTNGKLVKTYFNENHEPIQKP